MLWFIPPPAAPHLWPPLLLLLSLSVCPFVRTSVRPFVLSSAAVCPRWVRRQFLWPVNRRASASLSLHSLPFPSVPAFRSVPLRRHLLFSYSFTIFASIILRSLSLLSMLFHFCLLLLLLLFLPLLLLPWRCCCHYRCCCFSSSSFDLLCMFIDQQTKPDTRQSRQSSTWIISLLHFNALSLYLFLSLSVCISISVSIWVFYKHTHTHAYSYSFFVVLLFELAKRKKMKKKAKKLAKEIEKWTNFD